MKKLMIAMLLCIGIVQLTHGQANLPNSATTSKTKEEQEIIELSKTKLDMDVR